MHKWDVHAAPCSVFTYSVAVRICRGLCCLCNSNTTTGLLPGSRVAFFSFRCTGQLVNWSHYVYWTPCGCVHALHQTYPHDKELAGRTNHDEQIHSRPRANGRVHGEHQQHARGLTSRTVQTTTQRTCTVSTISHEQYSSTHNSRTRTIVHFNDRGFVRPCATSTGQVSTQNSDTRLVPTNSTHSSIHKS